ncbi:MAG TPA: carboxypeptidase-like regulatory domain-containing protein [Planctomycetota bacterium]|nr:carboxypeptidase-like regulatory domain-containing protein [Planctomycetota bacterium]
MSRRARRLAVFAAAIAIAAGAILALDPRGSSADGARDDRPARDAAASAAAVADRESERASAGGDPQSRPSEEPGFVAMPALETVAIRGRLVVASTGAPPKNAAVWLRTGDDEIDFRRVVERLGGRRGIERLRRAERLDFEAHAIGGWAPTFTARAAADGTFELRIPNKLARFALAARGDGAVYERAEVFELTPQRIAGELVLLLDDAGRIEGRLTDAAGEPARGGVVAIRSSRSADGVFCLDTRFADADAEGRFAFEGVATTTCELAASAADCAPVSRSATRVEPKATTRADIVLPPGGSLDGIVVDAEDRPLAGRFVRASFEGIRPWAPWYGLGRSDADGRFRLDGLAKGTHRVVAENDGLVQRLEADELLRVDVPAPPGAPPLRVVLEEGAAIAGRAVDGAGEGLADVAIVVVPSWSGPDHERFPGKRYSMQAATSGSDGRFRATGLGDGPFVVGALLEGVGWSERAKVAAGTKDLEIAIAPNGIAAHVVDATTSAPVERFRAGLLPAGEGFSARDSFRSGRETTFESKDGALAFRGVPAGTWSVFVIADGFGLGGTGRIAVKSGAIADGGVIRLSRAAVVRGRLIDAVDGLPVDGARLERIREDPSCIDLPHEFGFGRAVSSHDGTFEMRLTGTDSMHVVTWHDRHLEHTSAVLHVEPGAVIDLGTIRLRRGGAVEGIALDAGAPMPQARVTAELKSAAVDETAPDDPRSFGTADENGRFLIEGLVPGTWSIEASPASESPVSRYDSAERKLRAVVGVKDLETTHVEFPPPLELGGEIVRGRVTRGGLGVAADVYVFVETTDRSASRSSSTTTDAEGRFRLAHVLAGVGWIQVRPWGASRANHQQPIAVASGRATDVNIELAAGGAIVGHVVARADGAPIAGAWLHASCFDGGSSTSANGKTDADGGFEIPHVVPGKYEVTVRGPWVEGIARFAPAKQTVDVVDGGTVTADFTVDAGARVRVDIVLPDGTPAANCSFSLEATGEIADAADSWSTCTNDDGGETVDGLVAGAYFVHASPRGLPPVVSEPVRVEIGGEARVRVQLRDPVTLRVHAVGAGGAAVAITKTWIGLREDAGFDGGASDDPAQGVEVAVAPGTIHLRVESGPLRGSQDLVVGSAPLDVVVPVK